MPIYNNLKCSTDIMFFIFFGCFNVFITPYAYSFSQAPTASSAFYAIRGDMFCLPGHLWPTARAQRWLTGGGEMSWYKHALYFLCCTFPQATLISSKAEPEFFMAVFSNSKQDSFLLRSPHRSCVEKALCAHYHHILHCCDILWFH